MNMKNVRIVVQLIIEGPAEVDGKIVMTPEQARAAVEQHYIPELRSVIDDSRSHAKVKLEIASSEYVEVPDGREVKA